MSYTDLKYFILEDNGATINGITQKLPGMILLPDQITKIKNISNGYNKSWFDEVSELKAMKVTELGDSSLINMVLLSKIELPALQIIGEAAFSKTKFITPDFSSNNDLIVHPNAFEFVTVAWIKLPPTYTLYEKAFFDIQTKHTIYSVSNQYTSDRDKYFSSTATIKPPTTLTQIDQQMKEMDEKITLLDKQMKRVTRMLVRIENRDKNSMQLLRAIQSQTMR